MYERSVSVCVKKITSNTNARTTYESIYIHILYFNDITKEVFIWPALPFSLFFSRCLELSYRVRTFTSGNLVAPLRRRQDNKSLGKKSSAGL